MNPHESTLCGFASLRETLLISTCLGVSPEAEQLHCPRLARPFGTARLEVRWRIVELWKLSAERFGLHVEGHDSIEKIMEFKKK